MKKIILSGIILVIAAFVTLNISANASKKAKDVYYSSAIIEAMADCEPWADWHAGGRCLPLSQICVFAVEERGCNPHHP